MIRTVAVYGRIFALSCVLLLGACAGGFNLPPEHRPQSYKVEAGDTLYAIAWHYGLDYHVVARWNGIAPPYQIHPGQRISLYPRHSSAPKRTVTHKASAPVVAKVKAIPAADDQRRSTAPQTGSLEVTWRWPASGAVHGTFGEKGIAGKGIVIVGTLGEPVVAAADGTVVYAGNALVGYGRLIIIKHNDKWLSAYAHNQRLLVREGKVVHAGDRIATMGVPPDGEPSLYFEIRRDGVPVNPLRFLSPKR